MIRLNDRFAVSKIDTPPQWTLCRVNRNADGVESFQAISFCQTKRALLVAIDEKVVQAARYYPGSINRAVETAQMAKIRDFPVEIDADWQWPEERP